MKIILTERQLNNTIEKTLKQLYPDIVSVSFKETPVKYFGGKEGGVGEYNRIDIMIVVDLGNVLKGNIYNPKNIFDEKDIKKDILNTLKTYMNIDGDKFKAPYGVQIYTLTTTSI